MATNISNIQTGFDLRILFLPNAQVTLTQNSTTLSATTDNQGYCNITIPNEGVWWIQGKTPQGELTAKYALNYYSDYSLYFNSATTYPLDGISYSTNLNSITEEQLNVIAKAISNNPSITNRTNDVYFSGSFGNFHLYTALHRKSSRNWNHPYAGNLSYSIVGFNHYTLSSNTAYGETTQTGKAGIVFMGPVKTYGQSLNGVPSPYYFVDNCKDLLSTLQCYQRKHIQLQTGGLNANAPTKTGSYDVFMPCCNELNAVRNLDGFNFLQSPILCGYVNATNSNRVTEESSSSYLRDQGTSTVGNYNAVYIAGYNGTANAHNGMQAIYPSFNLMFCI